MMVKALSQEEDANVGGMTYYWRSEGKGAKILLQWAMLLHSEGVGKKGPKILSPNSTPGLQLISLNRGH